MDWSRTQGINVLAGRRGVEPEDFGFLELAVLPGGFPEHVHSFALMAPALEELRRLHERTPAEPGLRVVKAQPDRLSLHGRETDPGELERLRLRLWRGTKHGIQLAGRRLSVRYWSGRPTGDERVYRYAHNYQVRDDVDGAVVALFQLTFIDGRWHDHDRVRVDVSGQGCARGFLVPLTALLLPRVLDPASVRVGVDIAVDIDAPTPALMILDSGVRARFHSVRGHLGTTPLGGGLELGRRSSRVSAVLYDKLAQVRRDAFDPKGRGLTTYAVEASLPASPFRDLTRIEVRLRGVEGVAAVPRALESAASRILVADLRRAPVPRRLDALLLALARKYGVSRAAADLSRARQRTVPPGGLGELIQKEMLRAKVPPVRALSAARGLQTRANRLLELAADRTDFELGRHALAAWARVPMVGCVSAIES